MNDIWQEIKPRLERFERPFPADAVVLACVHREKVAPHLVEVIEAIANDPAMARDNGYMLHVFAMHLLAAWRDARAYRPLARWGHFPRDVLDDLLGEILTESYGRCLASLCDGELGPIKTLIEDESADDWARGAGITALVTRVLEGEDKREDLIAYLSAYGEQRAVRARAGGSREFDILDAIVGGACEIGTYEMLPMIRQWFADDLLDETFADLKWVEKAVVRPFAEHQADQLGRRGNGYVRDVADEIAWFASYSDDDGEQFEDEEYMAFHDAEPQEPYVRAFEKTGRNDPCPCGSGKKYKKCHGA